MMRVAYDLDRDVMLDWAAQRIGCGSFGPNSHAIAQMDGKEISAVVVYDDFTPWNCLAHIASDGGGKFLNKNFLFRMFAYPFIQLGLGRVTLIIRESNSASLRFARHLGFEIECASAKRLFGKEDGVIFRMLQEDCRWITPKFRALARG